MDKLVINAQIKINEARKLNALYCNMKRRNAETKYEDFVLLEKHCHSHCQKRVDNFDSKLECLSKLLETVNDNLTGNIESG